MLRTLGKGLLAIVALTIAVELLLQAAALWAQWRYQRADTLLQPDRVRILCLGDSNTYGLYLPAQDSWPSQLQGLLDRQSPGRYQVINLGFPGTPTFRIAENLPSFLARFQPDRVIVLAGVNDFLYGAIDAAKPAPSLGGRIRAFASTHLRLYRAWLLWQRVREAPLAISNDMDALGAGLLSLASQDDAQALRTLVRLYRERGFTVRESGDDAWLEHQGRSVHLNEALPAFRSGDLYALTNTYLRLPIQAGMDLRDADLHAQVHINGASYELQPLRGKTGEDEAILEGNLAQIAALTRQANIPLLLLTYASHEHYYGRVNQALRAAASHRGIPLLDVERAITAQCPDAACTALFFPDYHPNTEGYRRMAALVAARLQAPAPQP